MNDKNKIAMPCGGIGICGKCRIKVVKGYLEPNDRDRNFLSDGEIKEGYRIACGHDIGGDIEFIFSDEQFDAIGRYIVPELKKDENISGGKSAKGNAVIIDVGTTTICFEVLNGNGEKINTVTMTNSQRAFGADVISRISKASAGGFLYLHNMLKSDIKKGIYSLLEGFSGLAENIFIAGNTTMTCFLRNIDVRSIGVYPFENNADDIFTQKAVDFFDGDMPIGIDGEALVTIMPCIHAFIGGDIVSGAYFLDFDKRKDCLFIDVGTNGEILLNSGGKLYGASAAGGPAFEGGGVSCGSGGVMGAINYIKYNDGSFFYKTIGNKEPIGLCGSAIIDVTAQLLENNIIDETGLLTEKYFSKGVKITEKIILKQEDIRQIQLAKSAIFSGIISLLNYAGAKPYDIKRVFVGGGFGFCLNPENVLKIKMFPEHFSGEMEFCGNTSLGGLAKAFMENSDEYKKFISDTEYVDLAGNEDFQNLFIENLNF